MADENLDPTENEPMELTYTRMDGSDQVYTFVDVHTRQRIEDVEAGFAKIIKDDEVSEESTYSSSKLETMHTELSDRITNIDNLIPPQATTENQLADKDFVNSTVATNTSTFKGTFETLDELKAVTPVTNNDYGYVIAEDEKGNTLYKRYKYSESEEDWKWEYDLNNSSFTAEEWKAIRSGVTKESYDDVKEKLYGNSEIEGSVDNRIKTEFDKRNIPAYWYGTQEAYDAIAEKEEGILYFITRDE